MSPQQTAEFVRTEQHTWRPIVRQLGLKAQ
jgi:hypothetical protein